MSSWNKTAATGERCVIELPLSYSRHQHDTLDKMFRIANNMKNNLIAWYSRQLTHRRMANQLLSMGDEFYVEDMRWKALAKRAKETRRNKKGKILSKKRYGKSIANKAPAMFLAILEQKVIASGGSFQRIVTWKAKASQFSHETGKCNKKKLSQRWHYLEDGTKVQRDLYSAFLIQHTNKNLESFNLRTCEKDFPIFLKMHQEEIERLQSLDKRMPSSMGIKKTA